jgi:hypothetical protein
MRKMNIQGVARTEKYMGKIVLLISVVSLN